MRKRVNERSDVSLNEASLKEKLNMLSRQRWTCRRGTYSGWITDRKRDRLREYIRQGEKGTDSW